MADITDKLRLKEKAEEDAYFARRDRERVKALREKRMAESLADESEKRKPAPGKSAQALRDTDSP